MIRFGTDGVRGVANVDLTPELLVALGRAGARVLRPPRFLVGRDTRLSGPMLQAALSAGLASEGADVVDLGVLPTPAVAWFSATRGEPAAVVSASHNPFSDNGVKFFAAGGRKLGDEAERALEAELEAAVGARAAPPPAPGRLSTLADHEEYRHALVGSLEGGSLEGLHVVLDCANGAASEVAPELFRRAGARVEVIHDRPDGTNINAGCGSTWPESLCQAVVTGGADGGLAFDGDADRVLAVDHRGRLVDGDHLLALLAADRRRRGRLPGDTVVVTVMSNLGFRQAMERLGIRVVETRVGDRWVLEALEQGGWTLGGEQSGHIVFRDLATTGDGILTGLQVLDVVARSGRPLAELASVMTRLPQVLRAVSVPPGSSTADPPEVEDEIRSVGDALGDRGRVLVRRSGTEPVVRVMVEAPTEAEAEAACARVCLAVERAFGASRAAAT